ncbi:MAG: type II and III secretion system protein, partial [Thermodesulfobacteriota bacterium]
DDIFFDPQYTIARDDDGNATSVLSSVEPRTISIGVVLDVTPQISSNGYIVMNIHPSVTAFVTTKTFTNLLKEPLATAPVINIRETDTVVRVRDGQTIIIAGMMSEKKSETITKSPLLGSIPVLGNLFRKTEQTLDMTELVILLTPTIMTGRRIDYLTQEELRRLESAKGDFHLGILRK